MSSVAVFTLFECSIYCQVKVICFGLWQAKGACIGDVFVATEFANHDRRIPIPVRKFTSQNRKETQGPWAERVH
jgi:hypothetical protein